MKNTLLRLKHTAKLEKLIDSGASYKEILKESKVLDEFITKDMKDLNNNKRKKASKRRKDSFEI